MSRRSSSSRRRSSSSRQSVQRIGPANLLLVAALIAVIYFWTSGQLPELLRSWGVPIDETGEAPPAVTGDGSLEAFFTTPELIYPDRPETRRDPRFLRQMIADIDNAQQSVDFAVFEYNLQPLADALIRAKQRGLEVRLALDRENLEKPEMAEWAGQVEDVAIPISWQETDGFLHSKFLIVDRQLVWMGSWNATINDTYRNNNNLLRISSLPVVENYQAEFDQMFLDGRFGSQKQMVIPNPQLRIGSLPAENYFSPDQGTQDAVVARLEQAQSSVYFLAFSYTSDPIGQAMIDAADRGLTVQGVFEKRNAEGEGSEFGVLRNAGIEVLEDGNCYTMHHKIIIIDENIVITGSYNFTRRAEETNDENLLIIEDPQLAQIYLEEYARVWEQAVNPTRCG